MRLKIKLRIITYSLNDIIGLLMYQCKQERINNKNESDFQAYEYINDYSAEREKTEEEIYEYIYTMDDAFNNLKLSNYQRVRWRNEDPLQLSGSQISHLTGTYVWKSKIFFNSQ